MEDLRTGLARHNASAATGACTADAGPNAAERRPRAPDAEGAGIVSGPDHACEHGCSIDWMLDPTGPDDPAWRARVRAEAENDRFYVRWKERNAS